MKFTLLMLMSLSVEGTKLRQMSQVRVPQDDTMTADQPHEVPECREGYVFNPEFQDCENINDPGDYYSPYDESYVPEEPCEDATCGPPSNATEYDMAQDIMNQFDLNGDNVITWKEIKQHVKAMAKEMVDWELEFYKE